MNIQDIAAWCKISFGSNPLEYAHHLYLNGEEIKDLIIPNSVRYIGDYAFYGCYGLTSLTIGNSVTSIGSSSFKGCSGLTSLTILCPKVGSWFSGIKNIKEVVISDGVESIGDGAFSYCSGLTSVTIGNNVTFIGGSAFSGCSGLTSLTIGNSVTSIGSSSFSYCSGLTSVTIGNSVTSIGSSAFYGCSGLTSLTIGNSVTSIGSSSFRGCSGLTSVTIPNCVTSIGDWTFDGCSGLTSVTIPNSVTSIGEKTFYGCSGLTSVISLNTTPPQISNSTFSNETYKSATLKVPVGCKNIYWLHPYWENFTKIEEIDLSAKQAEAQEAYNKAQDVYLSYLFYYQDQRPKFYQQVLDEYNENSKVARVLLDDIYSVKKEVSFSNMSTEDKASFNKTLDELYYFVSNLEKENEKNEPPKGFHADYYEYISAYYERLNQYKERIDAAQTNAELDAIISEMNADANQTETEIRKDYDELINIESVIVRISRDLAALRAQLETIIVEIDAIEFLQKKEDAIAIYNDGIAFCNGFVDFDANIRKTDETIREQQSYNHKIGSEIDGIISEMKKMIKESEIDAEKKSYFLNVLDSVDNAKDGYIKWTNEHDSFYLIRDLDNAKIDFANYSERLEDYKNKIESATSVADIEAVIEQMNNDKSNMESEYLIPLQTEYNYMLQFMESCKKYEAELLKLHQRLKGLKSEFDNMASGIEQVLLSDSDVIVVSLRGERMIMKSSQIRALPKGIYIINGKKFVVK